MADVVVGPKRRGERQPISVVEVGNRHRRAVERLILDNVRMAGELELVREELAEAQRMASHRTTECILLLEQIGDMKALAMDTGLVFEGCGDA